ncbi:hypothetical protein ACFX10_008166 [Malus domestica]
MDNFSDHLKQRRAEDPAAAAATGPAAGKKSGYRSRRDAALGSSDPNRVGSKTFLIPPLWALRLTCMASSFLMGLAASLAWAEGGFHKNQMALPRL